MIALLVTATLLAGGGFTAQHAAQEEATSAAGLIGEGRYAEAVAVLETEQDPVIRHMGLTDAYLRAGDPVGALREVKLGLAAAPEHLMLLWSAIQAAQWLKSPSLSDRYTARLAEAVERADYLNDDQRAQWRDAARDFASGNAELVAGRDARDAAVGRARTVAGIGLIGAIVALLALALRP